jgi:hypothetical protein
MGCRTLKVGNKCEIFFFLFRILSNKTANRQVSRLHLTKVSESGTILQPYTLRAFVLFASNESKTDKDKGHLMKLVFTKSPSDGFHWCIFVDFKVQNNV